MFCNNILCRGKRPGLGRSGSERDLNRGGGTKVQRSASGLIRTSNLDPSPYELPVKDITSAPCKFFVYFISYICINYYNNLSYLSLKKKAQIQLYYKGLMIEVIRVVTTLP